MKKDILYTAAVATVMFGVAWAFMVLHTHRQLRMLDEWWQAHPVLSRAEIEIIIDEQGKKSPVNHVHMVDGTCIGQGCDVDRELLDKCGEPPLPPAEWADGGYEKMLREMDGGGSAL